MNLIPNIPAKAFSFSAIVVGYLLIDDLTANEQNAFGNWLMLTAQVLRTNAFYKQVQQERSTNVTDNMNNSDSNITIKENVAILQKMVNALNKEIETLKKDAKY